MRRRKPNVVVIGILPMGGWTCVSNERTPDGNYYWLTITGLIPGTEYAINILLIKSIRRLPIVHTKDNDPNKRSIHQCYTYPNLKTLSAGAKISRCVARQLSPNIMAGKLVYQTIAELNDHMTCWPWLVLQSMLSIASSDSLPYLKNTGINAIELMPYQWMMVTKVGIQYLIFYFAPDKYYGTKNKLKN